MMFDWWPLAVLDGLSKRWHRLVLGTDQEVERLKHAFHSMYAL